LNNTRQPRLWLKMSRISRYSMSCVSPASNCQRSDQRIVRHGEAPCQ
jgi:hypothetical protein